MRAQAAPSGSAQREAPGSGALRPPALRAPPAGAGSEAAVVPKPGAAAARGPSEPAEGPGSARAAARVFPLLNEAERLPFFYF